MIPLVPRPDPLRAAFLNPANFLTAEDIATILSWDFSPTGLAATLGLARGEDLEFSRILAEERTARGLPRSRHLRVVGGWFWSKSAGRVLLAEHFYCESHGQAFARCHQIPVDPSPADQEGRPLS